MRTKGRRKSTNVRDARGQKVVAGGAGLGVLLRLVGQRFGMKGIIILAVLGIAAWQFGLIDPAALMGGGQVRKVDYTPTAAEQERFQFVEVAVGRK